MILIKNIGLLVGIQPEGVLRLQGPEMSRTGTLPNAWLAIENGRIADFGSMEGGVLRGTPFRFAPLRPLPQSTASCCAELVSCGPLPLPVSGGGHAPGH